MTPARYDHLLQSAVLQTGTTAMTPARCDHLQRSSVLAVWCEPISIAAVSMGNENFEPDAETWDLFHQMLNGPAQDMAGSSVPPRSSHVPRERSTEGCSVAALLPEAWPVQPKAASLLLGGSPLGVVALALAAQVAPAVEWGSSAGLLVPSSGRCSLPWEVTLSVRGASLPLCRSSLFMSLGCEAGLRSCSPFRADLVCGGCRGRSWGEWW